MYKFLISALIFGFLGLNVACNKSEQEETPYDPTTQNPNGLTFELKEIDYVATAKSEDIIQSGSVKKIKKGSNGVREFYFTNTSEQVITISKANGSCGCTVPEFPKDPIAPGAGGVIKVTYDTNRQGAFTKFVYVTASGAPEVYTVKIFGDVE